MTPIESGDRDTMQSLLHAEALSVLGRPPAGPSGVSSPWPAEMILNHASTPGAQLIAELIASGGWCAPTSITYDLDPPERTTPMIAVQFAENTALIGPFEDNDEADAYIARYREYNEGADVADDEWYDEPMRFVIHLPILSLMPMPVPDVGVRRGGVEYDQENIINLPKDRDPEAIAREVARLLRADRFSEGVKSDPTVYCQFEDVLVSKITGRETRKHCGRPAAFEVTAGGEGINLACQLHIGLALDGNGRDEFILRPLDH